MSDVAEFEKIFCIKLNGAEFKGEKVCLSCGSHLVRCLHDLPKDFDWAKGYREKLKLSGLSICNHCTYHIFLLSIVGVGERGIDVKILVKAYEASMNLEDIFFEPSDLSCSTVHPNCSFRNLEMIDSNQSLYCQTFNNAYDLCRSGGHKVWFNTKNWHNVLNYQRGRFAHLI